MMMTMMMTMTMTKDQRPVVKVKNLGHRKSVVWGQLSPEGGPELNYSIP